MNVDTSGWSDRSIRAGVLMLGQVVSVLTTSTGFFAQSLSQEHGVSLPSFQASTVYLSLFVCYVLVPVALSPRLRGEIFSQKRRVEGSAEGTESDDTTTEGRSITTDEDPLLGRSPRSKAPSWAEQLRALMRSEAAIVMAIAMADLEANFLIIQAYKYTGIQYVMLINCFSTPCVMCLSYIVLRARFSGRHLLGVGACLSGILMLIVTRESDWSVSWTSIKGDILVLASAVLYAVSNVGQEFVFKSRKLTQTRFLGLIGMFGSFFSVSQTALMGEYRELATVPWSWSVVGHMVGFTTALVLMYSVAPLVIRYSSATLLNLSLLTTDFYGLAVGILVFGALVQLPYYVALALVVVGITTYNLAELPAEALGPA